MARERPEASDVLPPVNPKPDPAASGFAGLTRAEAHALRRSTPLTPAKRRGEEQEGDPRRPR